VKLLVPKDLVVAGSPDDADFEVVPARKIPEGKMALDIGPETLAMFKKEIDGAGTIFWNGPMGLFEKPPL
jgi:phosphoglycerate kinase